jgi:methionyl-tRNA formyltransferase
MNITIFGCKDSTLHLLKFFKKNHYIVHLVTIDKEIASKNDIAGFIDLSHYNNLFETIYLAESYNLKNDRDLKHFEIEKKSTIAFCIGWQRLIPEEILGKFNKGVFGMHGSARNLPFGKGRSPMNWSIIEGRKLFYTNLFKYQNGIDNGPVVGNSVFSILDTDTAETLHFKNTLSMIHLIRNHIKDLLSGAIKLTEQKNLMGSFYPKRESTDSVIDWRDDIENIDRLIRAVAPPFSGGICSLNSIFFYIYRASKFYTDVEFHTFLDANFGEILDVMPNGKFLVRCSGGVLLVHEFSSFTIKQGDQLDILDSPFKKFKRNVYGFFDI